MIKIDVSTRNILLFFIVIGTAIRLWQLEFQCAWLEEQYTIWITSLDWYSMIYTSITVDFTPPLYYIVAKTFSMVFPYWWSMRIPSVIFGVLVIPAMYLLGREYKDDFTGVLCTGIASILFPLVYYSQYGRAYALLHFLFVVFLIFYLRECKGKQSIWFWVAGILCIYTHLFAVIPVFLVAADIIRRNYDIGIKSIFYGFITFSIATIPLIIIMFGSIILTRSSGSEFGLDPAILILTTPGEIFGVLFVVLGVFVIVSYFVTENKRIWSTLVLTSIITIISGIALSGVTSIFPRYYAATSGIILLLFAGDGIASAIKMVESKIPLQKDQVAAIIIVVFLALQYTDFVSQYTIQKYVCTNLFGFTT